jgi:tRNA (mo5U34)-methyltransferase
MLLADEVARFTWFHSIDLGNGVVTPGRKSQEVHRLEFAALYDPVDLAGASVLDIGAWNGANSFEAKRRGAARVKAVDCYTWDHPEFRGRETFELARAALGLEIECETIDVMALTPERCGVFDVVVFAGVLYHLENPLEGLARAASVAGDLLVVETHVDLEALDRPAMVYYPAAELNGDESNWWGPNPLLVEALLRRHGFAHVAITPSHAQRTIFHAWRSLDRCKAGV